MKPCIHLSLVAAVLAGWGAVSHAQETQQGPAIGKVLLLRNGRVMEGDLRQTSTEVFVRNGPSEIGISAQLVLRICADWDDAYAFVQTLIKQNDVNDRVHLARWCHRNGLIDKALEQARQALVFQPNHAEARQIVAVLERERLETPKAKPAAMPKPSMIVQAEAVEPAGVDVVAETQISFALKVQPILMNTCANCHCTGRGGKFQLERVSGASQKAATQQNLANVLAYIDLERPAISPLLVKAIMRHGKAQQPPLRDREARPFQTMQDWIVQTIARNPQLKDYHAAKNGIVKAPPRLSSGVREAAMPLPQATAVPAPARETVPVPAPGQGPELKSSLIVDAQASLPVQENPPPRVLPASVTQAPSAVAGDDPFEPALFNKTYHPQR